VTAVLVVGAGGHGRVLADAARAAGLRVLGFTDRDATLCGRQVDGIEVLGDDSVLARFDPREVSLVNGLGTVRVSDARGELQRRLSAAGWTFASVIHPRAVLAGGVELGAGVQVMAGAIAQPGARLADGALLNTGAIVDHDCAIGEYCHVGPGAVLSGGVTLGAGCHVGTGATLIQGVRLGARCLVGAGAVVVASHGDDVKLLGVPARPAARA
jgi:sugar O-acyltransferase (sialic acid O-acetyltransferase NeuD family)